MTFRIATLALLLLAGDPGVSYFSRVRNISVASPQQANYIVLDEEILQHANPSLSDLRIFDSDTQVPYALSEQPGGLQGAEHEAKILNLGVVAGRTEFDLDLESVTQYNHIRLALEAKDFLVTAQATGKDALTAGDHDVVLGSSTLYDFSREGLGGNSTLKMPTASFRYIHVSLTPGISPKQVQAASVYSLEEKKSYWTEVGSCGQPRQVPPRVQGMEKQPSKPVTVIDCEIPANVRVDRLLIQVASGQINFRRSVEVTEPAAQGSPDSTYDIASGDISRVQIKRGGTVVNSENLSLVMRRPRAERFTVTISNGDDPPLAIDRVQPQAVEQRLFFEPKGKTQLRLYYGDEKLGAPIYDYAKFFKNDTVAVQAQLGPAEVNATYTGRPDDRPWSERHKAVMWIAMILAVVGLGVLALRGIKQG